MNETLLTTFIVVAMLVIIVQGGFLIAMFFGLRKTSEKVESLATQVETRAIPVLESAKQLLDDVGPKISTVTTNLADVSETVKSQVGRVDDVMSEFVDRTRLQAIRVDELVSRTIDKVEETTELVQETVITPVKQFSGIIHGLSAGIGAFLARRRKAAADSVGVEDEELFI
jgi:methyl-accepting chemotaxis protein